MNIFQKIRDLFTDEQPTTNPLYDELDAVLIPDDTVLDGWLQIISEDDYNAVMTAAQQVAMLNKNHRQLLAMVRYLNLKYPDQSIETHIELAKRKIAPLATRFEGLDQPEWTEAELDSWIDGLSDHYRDQIMNIMREYKNRGGQDGEPMVKFLCKLRRKTEQCLANDAQAAEANQMSLLRMWYIWQEEGRKMEQQKFFTNANRQADKRGYY